MPSQEQVMQQQQKAQQQEEMRKELLQKILTPEAQERINRIQLVKPEKARATLFSGRLTALVPFA